MTEIWCEKCNWKGKWNDLYKFPASALGHCPDCGHTDSIIDVGGVSEADYRDQELNKEKIE